MATASVTNTLVTATTIVVSKLNTNFQDLVTFLNNSVLHRDGTKAMTGALDMGTQKITNLVDGTAATDGATFDQATNADNLASGTVPEARLTAATTSVVGVSQLSDSVAETSSVKSATPTAVKTVRDQSYAKSSDASAVAGRKIWFSDGAPVAEGDNSDIWFEF